MSLSPTSLTSAFDTSGGTAISTASITTVVGRLYTVFVQDRVTTGAAPLPTLAGAGQTWTQIATMTSVDTNRRMTAFTSGLVTAGATGALTFTYSTGPSSTAWDVEEWQGASGTIVQSVTGDQEAANNTSLTMTLNPLASSANAAYGMFRQGTTATMTAGQTQLVQINNATVTASIMSEWALNSTSISATWPSTSTITIGIAIEVAAAGVPFTPAYSRTIIDTRYGAVYDPRAIFGPVPSQITKPILDRKPRKEHFELPVPPPYSNDARTYIQGQLPSRIPIPVLDRKQTKESWELPRPPVYSEQNSTWAFSFNPAVLSGFPPGAQVFTLPVPPSFYERTSLFSPATGFLLPPFFGLSTDLPRTTGPPSREWYQSLVETTLGLAAPIGAQVFELPKAALAASPATPFFFVPSVTAVYAPIPPGRAAFDLPKPYLYNPRGDWLLSLVETTLAPIVGLPPGRQVFELSRAGLYVPPATPSFLIPSVAAVYQPLPIGSVLFARPPITIEHRTFIFAHIAPPVMPQGTPVFDLPVPFPYPNVMRNWIDNLSFLDLDQFFGAPGQAPVYDTSRPPDPPPFPGHLRSWAFSMPISAIPTIIFPPGSQSFDLPRVAARAFGASHWESHTPISFFPVTALPPGLQVFDLPRAVPYPFHLSTSTSFAFSFPIFALPPGKVDYGSPRFWRPK